MQLENMNSTDQRPGVDVPAPDQKGKQQAATALSQIVLGFLMLLRVAGSTIVRLAARCFRFMSARLDTFTKQDFGPQGLTQRVLRASQKPAQVVVHFIKRWRLAELETAPVFVRSAVICIALIVAYGLFGAVFSSAPPAKVVRIAVSRDVGGSVTMADGITQNELAKFGLGNSLKSFKITNHYTRKINGEKFHVYDYVAQVASISGARTSEGTLYLVKRGSEWYSK